MECWTLLVHGAMQFTPLCSASVFRRSFFQSTGANADSSVFSVLLQTLVLVSPKWWWLSMAGLVDPGWP